MFEEILNNHLRKCSDITSYLTIGRVNEIILESSTRGQIYINLYSKSFVTW